VDTALRGVDWKTEEKSRERERKKSDAELKARIDTRRDFASLGARLSKPVSNLFSNRHDTLSALDFRGDCQLLVIKGIKLI